MHEPPDKKSPIIGLTKVECQIFSWWWRWSKLHVIGGGVCVQRCAPLVIIASHADDLFAWIKQFAPRENTFDPAYRWLGQVADKAPGLEPGRFICLHRIIGRYADRGVRQEPFQCRYKIQKNRTNCGVGTRPNEQCLPATPMK
jgi:hypothetical protein